MLTQVVLRSTYIVNGSIVRNVNRLQNIQLRKSMLYIPNFMIKAVHNNRSVSYRNVKAIHNMANELTSKAQLSNSSTPLPQSAANAPFERINTITKSIQDNRDYRGLKLSNGMKVILISDPTTDKSAAALSVAVGHLSDPTEIPGLAHLCEHMLFLGTAKYPKEDEYTSFLKAHGGNSNAATCSDITKYYFDVIPGKLEDALDRFSQFFIAPLFNEEVTEREINAVNSEHEKNLSQDMWRIKQVTKALCKPSHSYSRFGTGNKETLSESPKQNNINVRNELIKFCNTWYSSNIMSLAVFGQASLDQLEAMVVKLFGQIENKRVVAPTWPEMPYDNDQLSTKTYIVPVKDIRSLTISFQMEDLEQYYKAGPDHYVSHLIGHEGKGSILSELKARGWCNKLSSGYCSFGRGFGSFNVMVDLTEDGFKHIDDTAKLIFQYINMLRIKKPQKWIFEEYCNLCEMLFRFKDKEYPCSLVTKVVSSMHLFPLEDVLVGQFLFTEWRPDLVEDLISKLTPDKAQLIIVGQKYEPLANAEERWYGTKYGVYKIEPSILEYWSTPDLNDNLSLPEPNPFIPTDFELLPIDSGIENFPTVIQDLPMIRTWFKQDVEFLKPKALMTFDFNSPLVYSNPLNCNLTRLFVQLLKDQLNEFLFEADLAGLGFGVSNTTSGISLSIGGYSHKQVILLQKVLDSMFNFKIDRRRFDILKEQYVRSLKNYQTEQPYQHTIYYLALLLTEQAWTRQELLDSTQLLTLDRLQMFIEQLLSQMHVECFIYGNVNKEKALQMTRLVEDKMKYTDATVVPLLARQLLPKREYKIGKGESFLFEATNEFHKSSCVQLYLQCGEQEPHSIFVDILSQLLSEKCYNQLRTKEQLGYVVYCTPRKANGICGLRIIVQSLRHPTYVEERIENFLNDMLDYLENLSDSEFNHHKEAIIALFLEKPKRLITQFNIYIYEISMRQYHFNRAQVEAEKLRTLTKQQVIDYYKEHILVGAPSRSTLSIHVVSTVEGKAAPDVEESPTEAEAISTAVQNTIKKDFVRVTDLASFKSSRSLYPLAQPYMEIMPKGGRCKL
ncbi:insulin-degrading enzyme [Anopheles marshallii]|uniref:insulin-degrading enzyme n=1 Tax=Anopheles marshallii TaxID=1521116 RepID=UPI00237B24AC|nr:insulin-degrading enzyme [Anopheles marshallii]